MLLGLWETLGGQVMSPQSHVKLFFSLQQQEQNSKLLSSSFIPPPPLVQSGGLETLPAAPAHHSPQSYACRRRCTPAADPHLGSEGRPLFLHPEQRPVLNSAVSPGHGGADVQEGGGSWDKKPSMRQMVINTTTPFGWCLLDFSN